MKIESETEDRLVVISHPWVVTVGTGVLGAAPILAAIVDPGSDTVTFRLFLFAIGAGALWLGWKYMPFLTVVFDRPSDQVSVTHHRVTGNRTYALALREVSKAMHQAQWSEGTRMERLALKMRDGQIPLEFGYVDTPRQPIADRINAWLGASI